MSLRTDLQIIEQWIPAGTRVLDLGCGSGELLQHLGDTKQVQGYGLEIDAEKSRPVSNGAYGSSNRTWTWGSTTLVTTVSIP